MDDARKVLNEEKDEEFKEMAKAELDGLGEKKVLVEEEIKQFGVGRVKIDGDFWQAKSLDNSSIQKGDFVEVVNVESIILIVKSLKK